MVGRFKGFNLVLVHTRISESTRQVLAASSFRISDRINGIGELSVSYDHLQSAHSVSFCSGQEQRIRREVSPENPGHEGVDDDIAEFDVVVEDGHV